MISNPRFSRRTLVKGLSLGAGATLVAPVVNSLVRQARGQVTQELRLLMVTTTNGAWPLYDLDFVGEEAVDAKYPNEKIGTAFVESQDINVPPIYQPLAAYRERMLAVDGLPQRDYAEGHYGGPQVFSGAANHVTIDQWIAEHIAADAPFKWAGLGFAGKQDLTLAEMNSSKHGGELVPFITSPSLAYSTYFGGGSEGDEALRQRLGEKRQLMLDFAGEDIRRAQQRLAGEERQKFEQYMTSVEELERRHRLLRAGGGAGCDVSVEADPPDVAEQIALQYDLAASILACGLSRVVWISIGGNELWGLNHDYVKAIRGIDASLHNLGHGDVPDSGEHNAGILRWNAEQLARVLDTLAAAPSANGTVLDETVTVFMNENGYKHHNRGGRFPLLILGNAGGKLKADGRYIRFPMLSSWYENNQDKVRSANTSNGLPQLWNSLAHAFGAPKDDFGKGGIEVSDGPLPELFV